MSRIASVVLCFLGLGVACAILLPFFQKTSEDWGWQRTKASLRRVSFALRSYRETHGRFPPAVTYGKDGQPLHSWRVHLLPYLEQDTLYRQLRLDEPWDSPHNLPLLKETPKCYRPAREDAKPPGTTHFLAILGADAPFEKGQVSESGGNAILVVEVSEPVPWAKPMDLAYDPDQPIPSLGMGRVKPVRVLGYDLKYNAGFTACFSDGDVRFMDMRIPDAALRQLITGEDNEKVGRWALDSLQPTRGFRVHGRWDPRASYPPSQ
jgi:hypothetical protein